jgi:ribosomal protein S18 acetylase RimI-like enzyme
MTPGKFSVDSFILRDENDIQAMRDLVRRLGQESTIDDFEELILLSSVRANTRLWLEGNKVLAFALVDDYNNLWFEIDPALSPAEVVRELVEWGASCVKRRNAETNANSTLDASCASNDVERIRMLEANGFARQTLCTLRCSRSLSLPIPDSPLPQGFSIRCVNENDSIESLVALHRAAFGTDHMTVEQRAAMMRSPDYQPAMDLVAVAPDGSLAAFCVCGIDAETPEIGYTDPIGTHPRHQKKGLGKAIVCAGMRLLKNAGVITVELGTSSENIPMQKLATSLGFVCVSEKLWFSKTM